MEVHHDPRTKQYIKNMLYDFLYLPVKQRYETQLEGIIRKNCTLLNTPYECFYYKGEVYVVSSKVSSPKRMPRLSPKLHAEMDDYLKGVKALNSHEIPFVLGYINKVLNSSNDIPDYMKLLPASIHSPLQEIVAHCPCRTTHLTDEQAAQITAENATPISLIKQRLVLNLIE